MCFCVKHLAVEGAAAPICLSGEAVPEKKGAGGQAPVSTCRGNVTVTMHGISDGKWRTIPGRGDGTPMGSGKFRVHVPEAQETQRSWEGEGERRNKKRGYCYMDKCSQYSKGKRGGVGARNQPVLVQVVIVNSSKGGRLFRPFGQGGAPRL